MEIILLTEENKAQWNEFCVKSADAWFWHTSGWMDYTLDYRPDLEPKQMSFFAKDNGQLIAVCPLTLEKYKDRLEFSFGGLSMPSPAFADGLLPKIQKNAQNAVFGHVDAEAQRLGVKKVSFRGSPLAPGFLAHGMPPVNNLSKHGYLDKSFETQILELTPSIDELKSSARKGHKYDINRSAKALDSAYVHGENADRNIFDQYCELHRKDAGIYTRPQSTYDAMYEFIRKGNAVLFGAKAKEGGQFIGFSYFIIYKNGIYYASASKRNDLIEVPVAHFLLWEAVKFAKEKGLKYFELGWQFYEPSFQYNTTKKESAISEFKRGFGGEPVPQMISEKYYDAEFFAKEYGERLENYKNYLLASKQVGEKENE